MQYHEFAEKGWHPLDLVVDQKKRITELEAENRRLREALRAIVEHKMLGIDPGTPSWRKKIEAARAALSKEEP